MKKDVVKFVTLSAVTLALNPAMQAKAMPVHGCDDDNITINVTTQGPDFATIIPCTTASGTVDINASTGAVTSGPACLSVTGTPFRARVSVAGNQGGGSPGTILVTLSSSVVINSAGNNMTATGLSLNPGAGTTYTFNAKKTEIFDIGGTLNIGTTQPGGTYNGSFTITANCL